MCGIRTQQTARPSHSRSCLLSMGGRTSQKTVPTAARRTERAASVTGPSVASVTFSGDGSWRQQMANAPFASKHISSSYLRVRTQSMASSSPSATAAHPCARCRSCRVGPARRAASSSGIVACTICPSRSMIKTPMTPWMNERRCTDSSIRPCVLTSISSSTPLLAPRPTEAFMCPSGDAGMSPGKSYAMASSPPTLASSVAYGNEFKAGVA
mmetsp:Transcript_12859/g.32910  ORF Transcript_12859/g.32910 Transcript_12859/m.32910 type:complete len:212 (+) Transcript_12859:49-684(+)